MMQTVVRAFPEDSIRMTQARTGVGRSTAVAFRRKNEAKCSPKKAKGKKHKLEVNDVFAVGFGELRTPEKERTPRESKNGDWTGY